MKSKLRRRGKRLAGAVRCHGCGAWVGNPIPMPDGVDKILAVADQMNLLEEEMEVAFEIPGVVAYCASCEAGF